MLGTALTLPMKTIYVNAADHANLSLLAAPEPLRGKLGCAQVVSSDAVPPDVVTMQSRLTLEDQDTGERTVVSLVYPSEAGADRARISVLDGLGMELFGAQLGDVVREPGTERRVRIAAIVYQPEDSMRANLVVRN